MLKYIEEIIKILNIFIFLFIFMVVGCAQSFAQNEAMNPSDMQTIQGLQEINPKNNSSQASQNASQNNDAENPPDMSPSALGHLGQRSFKNFNALNLLQQIDSQNQKLFEGKIKYFLEKYEKITLFILYALVLFAIITNALIHIIKGASLKSFMVDFLLILFFANFWQILILNWQGMHQNILDFLNSQGFEIKAQRYQDWLNLLFEYTQRVLNLIDHNLNQTVVVLAFFLPVLYLWVRWLVLYISAVVQAVVIAQLMVILFAFAPISPHYAKKPMTYTIASLIKIILLQIMALCFSELVNFYLSQPLDIAQLLILFMMIYLLLTLAQHLEKLLDQIFNHTSFIHQFNIWQHDFKQNWQSQASELIQAIRSRDDKKYQSTSPQQSIYKTKNQAENHPTQSYQMKKEPTPHNSESSQNLNASKPTARFEKNINYQNNNASTTQAKSLESMQKHIWQIKVDGKSDRNPAVQERMQKENQGKKFGVKK